MIPAPTPDDNGPIDIPDSVWQRVMFPKQEALEESRRWWSKEYGRELTTADAAEINKNLFGLFRLLFKEDARQRRIAAGEKVVDEEKVRTLRWDIHRLEDQVKAMAKMIGRWPKDSPQRLTLEQARAALEEQATVKRKEVHAELNCAPPPPGMAPSDGGQPTKPTAPSPAAPGSPPPQRRRGPRRP